eukprot:7391561-Prymnesium_polylepis.2
MPVHAVRNRHSIPFRSMTDASRLEGLGCDCKRHSVSRKTPGWALASGSEAMETRGGSLDGDNVRCVEGSMQKADVQAAVVRERLSVRHHVLVHLPRESHECAPVKGKLWRRRGRLQSGDDGRRVTEGCDCMQRATVVGCASSLDNLHRLWAAVWHARAVAAPRPASARRSTPAEPPVWRLATARAAQLVHAPPRGARAPLAASSRWRGFAPAAHSSRRPHRAG